MGRRRRELSPNQDIVRVKQFYYFDHFFHLTHLVMLLRIRRGKYIIHVRKLQDRSPENIIFYTKVDGNYFPDRYTHANDQLLLLLLLSFPCIVYYVIRFVNVLIKTNEFCVQGGKITNVRRKSDLFSQSPCNIHVYSTHI